MLTYTPESKTMLHHLLYEAKNWGKYSEQFISELHHKLSIMHLRDDNIFITYVEFKATPVQEEKMVKFSCELSLRWSSGIVGGLVWDEFNKTFSIHT